MRNLKFVRALMFFAAFAAAVAGGAAQAAEQTQVVDITGIQSYDYYGTPGNAQIVLDVGALSTITSISWDFTFTAFYPSWLAEMEINFDSSAGYDGVWFTPSFTEGPGTESSSGSVSLVDQGISFQVLADGLLVIEFSEGYKDFDFGEADGQYDFGTLTIGYNTVAAAVPEPSTYGMLLLGLAGVGFMARRRRNS